MINCQKFLNSEQFFENILQREIQRGFFTKGYTNEIFLQSKLQNKFVAKGNTKGNFYKG